MKTDNRYSGILFSSKEKWNHKFYRMDLECHPFQKEKKKTHVLPYMWILSCNVHTYVQTNIHVGIKQKEEGKMSQVMRKDRIKDKASTGEARRRV